VVSACASRPALQLSLRPSSTHHDGQTDKSDISTAISTIHEAETWPRQLVERGGRFRRHNRTRHRSTVAKCTRKRPTHSCSEAIFAIRIYNFWYKGIEKKRVCRSVDRREVKWKVVRWEMGRTGRRGRMTRWRQSPFRVM
jgi:hypothetical protein